MPRGELYDRIETDMSYWDVLGADAWRGLVTGRESCDDAFLYNASQELLVRISVWHGQMEEASLHDLSLDFAHGLYLVGDLCDEGVGGDREIPKVDDEQRIYDMGNGDRLDPEAAVQRLASEPGWAPLTQERVERAFAANYIRRLRAIGWVEDEVRVETPEGTIVAHDADGGESYPGIVVDLVKPDGTEGQVAMVEHDAFVAEGDPTARSPLHVIAWNGVDEDPEAEVSVDPSGPEMDYAPRWSETAEAPGDVPDASAVMDQAAQAAGRGTTDGDGTVGRRLDEGSRHA